MQGNQDGVWEDMMQYKVFDVDSIDELDAQTLKNAISKDPKGHINKNVIDELLKSDNVKTLVRINTFIEEVGKANTLMDLSRLDKEKGPLGEDYNSLGTNSARAISSSYESALSTLDTELEDTKRALAEGRRTSIEIREARFRNFFLEDITAEQVRSQRKRNASGFAKFYNTSEEEAIGRLRELGLEVTDEGVIE